MPVAPRVLVLYASTHGHTGKIADRIGALLREQDVAADVRKVGQPVDVARYDGVIVGASVHAGQHQSEIVEWISTHHAALNARPSAFFSVSLTAADDTDEARATTLELIDDVLDATGWIPTRAEAFAGALQFREYHLPTRVVMRLIARKHGGDIDRHEDTDFTDWAAVERFVQRFATAVAPSTPAMSAAGR
jgi:menaquinone-dependent protoporphyrinogen oxidase